MNYLIDTHCLIWNFVHPEKIPAKIQTELKNPDNKINISAVSYWEVSLKYRLKKINLSGVLPSEFPKFAHKMGFESVDLTADIVSSFYKLPIVKNKDPFDRMLAWQAICGNYTLISKDKGFDSYKEAGLKRLW